MPRVHRLPVTCTDVIIPSTACDGPWAAQRASHGHPRVEEVFAVVAYCLAAYYASLSSPPEFVPSPPLIIDSSAANRQAVIEAFLAGREVAGCSASTASGASGSPSRGAQAAAHVYQVQKPRSPYADTRCRADATTWRDGFVNSSRRQSFVTTRGGHDPVPPLAAAAASRAVVDQLADLAGRDGDRRHHLPAHRRPGRRAGDPAEVLPDRP